MLTKEKTQLVPVAAKLDSKLLEKARKKMAKDRRRGLEITWRSIWEAGINMYLKEKSK